MPIATLVPRRTREDAQLADLLDRRLTLSSASLRFLGKHGFDVEHALGAGVPYLARDELRRATERFLPAAGAAHEAVDLAALDDADARFCAELRATLREWLQSAPAPVTPRPPSSASAPP